MALLSVSLVSAPIHDMFTRCDPPPPSVFGATTTHTFGSRISADVSLGGVPLGRMEANGDTTVRVTFTHMTGDTRFFETEIVLMSLTGTFQSIPFTVQESPTLRSLGQTTITSAPGGFLITSFFDVFTELSVVNLPFSPSDVSGRMTLVPEPASMVALGFGLAALASIKRRRKE